MNKQLFNNNWYFSKFPIEEEISLDVIKAALSWELVEIPHDFLIYDVNDLYENTYGVYYKDFIVSKDEIDNRISFRFDGVYMDVTVYINDREAVFHPYGYSTFEVDITELVTKGSNRIVVVVKHMAPNSRWYSGAGIYRNVWMITSGKIFVPTDGVYICANSTDGKVDINVEIEGKVSDVIVKHTVFSSLKEEVLVSTGGEFQSVSVSNPLLWSIEETNLYTLHTELILNNQVIDSLDNNFGFRKLEFKPNEGFFCNDRYYKLHGVCLHHDLGALGAAFNTDALRRQLEIMKDMGVNSIRTSHNMPAPELMDLCDEMGFFVVSEAFDMWEFSKTTYDYARYFNEYAKEDVKSWVRRDRNHPSLIMWSIGNEIYDTHASTKGVQIANMLRDNVELHDPNKNGFSTIGSNFMEWENAQKVADTLKFAGYNYAEHLYEKHHEKYPDWIIYGSETSSALRSRGIYNFPAHKALLTNDNLQCSSFDNSVARWGKSAEQSIIDDRDSTFCAGQYVWTGFDYIGEPTPYTTKNSYFGIVDTAGFNKDVYYLYKSAWTDYKATPFVHLLPYWDFNEGQIIDVFAYTNAPKVELFVNDISLGVQEIDQLHGKKIHGEWSVPYTKGFIKAVAYDDNNLIIASDEKHSFSEPVNICLKANKESIKANGTSLSFIEISLTDTDGFTVENARNRIKVEVLGEGRLVGLDNGDSTDYDQYKSNNRKMFSGKLLAIISSTLNSGDIIVTVSGIGLNTASIKIKSVVEVAIEKTIVPQIIYNDYDTTEVPVRKIELSTANSKNLTSDNRTCEVTATLLPINCTYKNISWAVVGIDGLKSIISEVKANESSALVTAYADGDFKLRAISYNGKAHPEIISEMEFCASGLGQTTINPYEFVIASHYTNSTGAFKQLEYGSLGNIDDTYSVTYDNIYFKSSSSDNLRLHIGNSLEKDVPIEIYEISEKEEKLLFTAVFPKNGRWDGHDPYDFKLDKPLAGIKTLKFVINDRITFGGFEFIETNPAFEQTLTKNALKIYGDNYTLTEDSIENIGNNVVLEFGEMNFTNAGTSKICIHGKTPNSNNTIQLKINNEQGSQIQILEFTHCVEYTTKEFIIDSITGVNEISFIFLPGSNFDFKWFKFNLNQ